jgi:hypothetical protein
LGCHTGVGEAIEAFEPLAVDARLRQTTPAVARASGNKEARDLAAERWWVPSRECGLPLPTLLSKVVGAADFSREDLVRDKFDVATTRSAEGFEPG